MSGQEGVTSMSHREVRSGRRRFKAICAAAALGAASLSAQAHAQAAGEVTYDVDQ